MSWENREGKRKTKSVAHTEAPPQWAEKKRLQPSDTRTILLNCTKTKVTRGCALYINDGGGVAAVVVAVCLYVVVVF